MARDDVAYIFLLSLDLFFVLFVSFSQEEDYLAIRGNSTKKKKGE